MPAVIIMGQRLSGRYYEILAAVLQAKAAANGYSFVILVMTSAWVAANYLAWTAICIKITGIRLLLWLFDINVERTFFNEPQLVNFDICDPV